MRSTAGHSETESQPSFDEQSIDENQETLKKPSLAKIVRDKMTEYEYENRMEEMRREPRKVNGMYRDTPNYDLFKLQEEIDRVAHKMEPIIDKIDSNLNQKSFKERLQDQANSIGLISKISGRFISFYADDLTEMLLDDFLGEVVTDMDQIEG